MVQELMQVMIGRYCLQRRLGQGSMAEVYLAQDTHTGRMVAIKLVDMENIENYQRLYREVEAVANLKHEHILPILDHGRYEGWYYMVTPFIAFGTLGRRMAQGPLSSKEVQEIFRQLTSALQFAHDHGIVHRDIKPANILLDQGCHVYLADFGLAKMVGRAHSLTQTGFTVGTPCYMAPELFESYPVAPTSDIYALGILLYEMLTRHTPFEAPMVGTIIWKHMQEQPAPPSKLNPQLSHGIDRVVLRALEKRPQDRFQTVLELFQAYRSASLLTEKLLQGKFNIPVYGIVCFNEINYRFCRLLRTCKQHSRTALFALALLCLCSMFALSAYSVFLHFHAATPLRSAHKSTAPSILHAPSPTVVPPQSTAHGSEGPPSVSSSVQSANNGSTASPQPTPASKPTATPSSGGEGTDDPGFPFPLGGGTVVLPQPSPTVSHQTPLPLTPTVGGSPHMP